jgi:nucleoside-diphosphate-sugar epimerase
MPPPESSATDRPSPPLRATALVTGGAGFIAAHVARHLLDRATVVVLDDLSGGFRDNVPAGAILGRGERCRSRPARRA